MALVCCPSCKKRISNRARVCQFCHVNLTGNIESLTKISDIKHSSQLLTHTFASLTLFIAGVVIWFWNGITPDKMSSLRAWIAISCFIVGFVGYLVTRVRLILYKRNKRD